MKRGKSIEKERRTRKWGDAKKGRMKQNEIKSRDKTNNLAGRSDKLFVVVLEITFSVFQILSFFPFGEFYFL